MNTDDEGAADDRYTPDEIKAAVDKLSKAEMARLIAMSRYFAKRCQLSSDDLRQEALCRALEGRRRCDRGTPILGFLWGVMRSLASEDVEAIKANRRPMLTADLLHDDGGNSDGDRVQRVDVLHAEDAVHARMDESVLIQKIEAEISGDEQLEMLVEGLKDNLRGEQLQELLGVDAKGLAALRKRWKRLLTSITPERIAS